MFGRSKAKKLEERWFVDELSLNIGQATHRYKFELEQVRDAINERGEVKIPDDWPDHDVFRFIRARKGDWHATVEMLESHLKWRQKVGVPELTSSWLEPPFRAICHQGYAGICKEGRPVYVDHLGAYDVDAVMKLSRTEFDVEQMLAVQQEHTRRLKYLATSLHTGNPVYQNTVILDVRGKGLRIAFSKFVRDQIKLIGKIGGQNYPEACERIIVVGAPSGFETAWNILRKFVDPRTAEKVILKKRVEDAYEFVDKSQLPKWMGGDIPDEHVLDDNHPMHLWNDPAFLAKVEEVGVKAMWESLHCDLYSQNGSVLPDDADPEVLAAKAKAAEQRAGAVPVRGRGCRERGAEDDAGGPGGRAEEDRANRPSGILADEKALEAARVRGFWGSRRKEKQKGGANAAAGEKAGLQNAGSAAPVVDNADRETEDPDSPQRVPPYPMRRLVRDLSGATARTDRSSQETFEDVDEDEFSDASERSDDSGGVLEDEEQREEWLYSDRADSRDFSGAEHSDSTHLHDAYPVSVDSRGNKSTFRGAGSTTCCEDSLFDGEITNRTVNSQTSSTRSHAATPAALLSPKGSGDNMSCVIEETTIDMDEMGLQEGGGGGRGWTGRGSLLSRLWCLSSGGELSKTCCKPKVVGAGDGAVERGWSSSSSAEDRRGAVDRASTGTTKTIFEDEKNENNADLHAAQSSPYIKAQSSRAEPPPPGGPAKVIPAAVGKTQGLSAGSRTAGPGVIQDHPGIARNT
eukprot:CAMPEP_0178998690 /NCGR_PEP_ID=MMETSP0795-20121207/9646_1 /TAXON_ID=88552 /ORGANISM="Amoebophrya sp., Strain Ameob2" /LENGTH=744 /DNA_ID=CAMNT_0020691383 /DNA_START=685 /DNA_END=2919 /DNA_ORIENTATION=-